MTLKATHREWIDFRVPEAKISSELHEAEAIHNINGTLV